jgi:hypothetical protein
VYLALSAAFTIKTFYIRPLAELATNEYAMEVIRSTSSKHLTKRSRVELMYHLTFAIRYCLKSIGLKLCVLDELANPKLYSIFINSDYVVSVVRSEDFSRGNFKGFQS